MTRSKLQHRVDALSSVLDSLKPGLAADLQVADKEALVRCNLVTRSALLSSDTAELDACGVDRSARDAILKAQQNKNTWRCKLLSTSARDASSMHQRFLQ